MATPALSPRWGWLLVSFTRREILGRYAGSASGPRLHVWAREARTLLAV